MQVLMSLAGMAVILAIAVLLSSNRRAIRFRVVGAAFALQAIIAFLALAGSAGQDVKKARLMGDAWRHWAARTSFVPFARQLGGRGSWIDTIPRPHALFGGIVLWLVATWGHGALGYMVAVLVIGLGIAGQVAWIHVGWWVDGYDWTPP